MGKRYDAVKSAITTKAAHGFRVGQELCTEVDSYRFFGEEQNGFQLSVELKDGRRRYFEVVVRERL